MKLKLFLILTIAVTFSACSMSVGPKDLSNLDNDPLLYVKGDAQTEALKTQLTNLTADKLPPGFTKGSPFPAPDSGSVPSFDK